MLAYNFIRAFMATAAGADEAHPRELSFKETLQGISAFRDSGSQQELIYQGLSVQASISTLNPVGYFLLAA
jgi:hypothetical protein